MLDSTVSNSSDRVRPKPDDRAITPGPWHVVTGVCHHDHPDTSADVLGPENQYIANCGCHAAAIANAHAIAALPALLAALKETLAYWDSSGFSDCDPDCECIVQSVQAAIAKAEGC